MGVASQVLDIHGQSRRGNTIAKIESAADWTKVATSDIEAKSLDDDVMGCAGVVRAN